MKQCFLIVQILLGLVGVVVAGSLRERPLAAGLLLGWIGHGALLLLVQFTGGVF
jgi:hypothetical protein